MRSELNVEEVVQQRSLKVEFLYSQYLFLAVKSRNFLHTTQIYSRAISTKTVVIFLRSLMKNVGKFLNHLHFDGTCIGINT
jgi:hypothetical protein